MRGIGRIVLSRSSQRPLGIAAQKTFSEQSKELVSQKETLKEVLEEVDKPIAVQHQAEIQKEL